jgi:hypothetical protein
MHSSPSVPHLRSRLLCGIPALVLASTLLPQAALAQVSQTDAGGQIAVSNVQHSRNAGVNAQALTPPAVLRTDTMIDSEAGIAGTEAVAGATANSADATLDRDALQSAAWPARATIRADAVTADGAAVITGEQSVRGGAILADASGAAPMAAVQTMDRSRAALTDNVQRADARGNDHLATLAGIGGGAVIASLQGTDAPTDVRAKVRGVAGLYTTEATDSGLSLSTTRHVATATSNATKLSLTTQGASPLIGTGPETTRVDDQDGAEASADDVITLRQLASGTTVVSAGEEGAPSGSLLYAGPMIRSAVAVDNNSLVGRAAANDARSRLDVDAGGAGGSGGKAAILSSQQADGQVLTVATGGALANMFGTVDASSISVSGNGVAASAIGNTSDAALHIKAASIANDGLETSPAGTAMVANDGTRTTTAAFAVHTDQQAGRTSVAAGLGRGAATAQVAGPIDASRVTVADNLQSVSATANDATSLLGMDAAGFASSADLLTVQSSDADARILSGTGDLPDGATIAPEQAIRASQLEIRSNAVEAGATGNRSSATLDVTAGAAMDNGSHAMSRSGALGDGFGASATLALSSKQRTGSLAYRPLITSDVVGRFAVTGNVTVEGSAIRVPDNSQQSSAQANVADNRLTVDAASVGDAGTALTSSQYGEAVVRATSVMKVAAPGTATASSVELSGNANQAVASANDAENRLEVSGGSAGTPQLARLEADMLGVATAEGSHVLGNTQFSTGSVSATAVTLDGGSRTDEPARPGLLASSLTISGNTGTSEAAGNRALNELTLDASTSGGLASAQMNAASVSAATTNYLVLDTPLFGGGWLASTVLIEANSGAALARGNIADNRLTLDGVGRPAGTVSVESDRFLVDAVAPASLVTSQANYGSISANAASRLSVPLNDASNPVTTSRLSIGGNSLSATAFANGAANSIMLPGNGSGIALVTSQANYAPVVARASTGAADIVVRDVRQSNLSITNSSVTASATGNIATNIVGTLH